MEHEDEINMDKIGLALYRCNKEAKKKRDLASEARKLLKTRIYGDETEAGIHMSQEAADWLAAHGEDYLWKPFGWEDEEYYSFAGFKEKNRGLVDELNEGLRDSITDLELDEKYEDIEENLWNIDIDTERETIEKLGLEKDDIDDICYEIEYWKKYLDYYNEASKRNDNLHNMLHEGLSGLKYQKNNLYALKDMVIARTGVVPIDYHRVEGTSNTMAALYRIGKITFHVFEELDEEKVNDSVTIGNISSEVENPEAKEMTIEEAVHILCAYLNLPKELEKKVFVEKDLSQELTKYCGRGIWIPEWDRNSRSDYPDDSDEYYGYDEYDDEWYGDSDLPEEDY